MFSAWLPMQGKALEDIQLCDNTKVYNKGDICEYHKVLYMSTHWTQNTLPEQSSVWLRLDIQNATDWTTQNTYQRASIVKFNNALFAATDWNINNCPIKHSACPAEATHYNSWVQVNIENNEPVADIQVTLTLKDDGQPLDNGAILINNVYQGLTNDNGILRLEYPLPDGSTEVEIHHQGASIRQYITPGNAYQFTLIFDDDIEVYTKDVELIGVPDKITPDTDLALSFKSPRYGNLLTQYIEDISIGQVSIGATEYLDELVKLNEHGVLLIKDKPAFLDILTRLGNDQLELCYTASNDNQQFFGKCVETYFAAAKIKLGVTPHAAHPNIDYSSVKLTALHEQSGFSLDLKLDENGKYQSGFIPGGHWKLQAHWRAMDGKTYNSVAFVELGLFMDISLHLKGYQEATSIDSYYTIHAQTPSQPVALPNSTEQAQEAAEPTKELIEEAIEQTTQIVESYLQSHSFGEPFSEAGSQPPRMLFVSSKKGGIQLPFPSEYEYTIDASVKTISLFYTMNTLEFTDVYLGENHTPQNDVWSVSLQGQDGMPFYLQSRGVLSQQYIEPILQPGSRGIMNTSVTEVFNLEYLPPGEKKIKVRLTAKDKPGTSGNHPTNVGAVLIVPNITIDHVKENLRVGNTRYVKNYASIPEAAQLNTFQRTFDLAVSKLNDVTIERVKVYLVPPIGAGDEILITDAGVGSPFVTNLGNDNYRVITTFKQQAISGLLQNAAFHSFNYRFEVHAEKNGTEAVARKYTNNKVALWSLPSHIARFGSRDHGGDGWASKGTYLWLHDNSHLITKVNDISGEHGRNIGHKTHKLGTDIDTLHFTERNRNGTRNYKAMRSDVIKALEGDAVAKERVIEWISNQRAGLALLRQNNEVARLYSGTGRAFSMLPMHWLKTLMLTGQLTANSQTLDTGLGSWSGAKIRFNTIHDNHDHITLDRKKLVISP